MGKEGIAKIGIKIDAAGMPFIMTPKDVRECLKYNSGKVYRLFNSKEFPSEKVNGKHIIPKPRFLTWLGLEVEIDD